MSTYNPLIPTGLVNLDTDYKNIQLNFQQADTSFGVNHTPFSVTPNNGKHKFVEMPISTVIPPGLAASEGTLYTKTASTVSELFYTPDTSTNEYQLTRTISASFSKFATNLAYGTPPAGFTQTGGWTFLPGGLLLQYGFFGKPLGIGSSGQVQFPVTWTTGAFSITLIAYRDSGSEFVVLNSTTPPTTTTFNYFASSNGSDGFFWQAIGK